jgi:hypothetical protein
VEFIEVNNEDWLGAYNEAFQRIGQEVGYRIINK